MMTLRALRLPASLCAQLQPFSSLASVAVPSAPPATPAATSSAERGSGSFNLSTASTASSAPSASDKPTTLIGAGIWARISALATQTSILPQPVAVELGDGHHVHTLASLGLRVLQKESPDAAKHQSVADLVLAASIPRKDLGRHLREAYELLQPNGHLVAAWNERDLCHPLSKAMARLRSSPLAPPSHPITTSATTTHPHMPPSLLNASPAAAAATAKAVAASSNAHCSHMSSSSAGSVAGMRGRGVSTRACAHADGCAVQLAGMQGAENEEGPLEYNDMRMLMESVVGEHGRSLFRVVAFSILPCTPVSDDAYNGMSGGPLTLPFETKMFVLRKAS